MQPDATTHTIEMIVGFQGRVSAYATEGNAGVCVCITFWGEGYFDTIALEGRWGLHCRGH